MTLQALLSKHLLNQNTFDFHHLLNAQKSIVYSNSSNCWWSATEDELEVVNSNTNASIVLVGTGFNCHILEKVIAAMALVEQECVLSLNKYHDVFDKTVVNLKVYADDLAMLRDKMSVLASTFFIDAFLQADLKASDAGLVVFDMDSTLIAMECIDEIARLAGVYEQVAAVTERAMQGEIAFSDSLHHRVACLEGVDLDALLAIRKRLPFMPGFRFLIEELKKQGWTLVIASGGFTYFADYIKEHYGFDDAFSNTLEVDKQVLTGKVLGKVVDAEAKAAILEASANKYNIPLAKTIAVGDGANDLVMMSKAAVGLAFRAKPTVQEKADNAIRFCGLEGLLYLLG